MVVALGLRNTPATFHSLMNEIFRDFIDIFLVTYLDDLLIFSKTKEKRFINLGNILRRLEKNKLYASLKKSTFMTKEV